MKVSDLSRVVVLEKSLFTTPWPEEAFKAEIDRKSALILEVDGKIEGYICSLVVLDEAEITNVAISKEKQRQGLGFLLISSMLEFLKNKGCVDIYLEVRENNLAAIKLYEKSGFEKFGIRRNYYSKPRENALVLRKNIG